jgi:hypothetical protein
VTEADRGWAEAPFRRQLSFRVSVRPRKLLMSRDSRSLPDNPPFPVNPFPVTALSSGNLAKVDLKFSLVQTI